MTSLRRQLLAFSLVTVSASVLVDPARAASIDVTQAFRFIRTDTYAESGGLFNHGVFTIAGPTTPAGGIGAQGSFVSTLEKRATIVSPTGAADSLARVDVSSLYQLGASELDFNVAGTLRTRTETSGDGRIQNPSPDPNCCRSFSFLNHFIEFELSEAASYSIAGTFDLGVAVQLQNLTTFGVAFGLGSGTLDPGRYRYVVSDSIELYGSTGTDRSRSLDVDFHLQTATAVPEPAAPSSLAILAILVAGLSRKLAA
jgi:hypothetical protein